MFFFFFAIKIANAASDSFLGRALFVSLLHCNCNPIAGATNKQTNRKKTAHFAGEPSNVAYARCAMCDAGNVIISRIADSRSFAAVWECVCVLGVKCEMKQIFVSVFVHEIGNGSCRGHKLKDGFKINKQVAWQIGRSQDSQLQRAASGGRVRPKTKKKRKRKKRKYERTKENAAAKLNNKIR